MKPDRHTTQPNSCLRVLRPRFHRQEATLVRIIATTLIVLPSLAYSQPGGLPALWPQGVGGQRARSGQSGAPAYLAMVGRTTARSERRLQRSISLVCPTGTKRRIRMLTKEPTDRAVGVEQAYRELHCVRPDGTIHGPVTQLRRYIRVRASTLMRRASLTSRNVVRFGQMKEGRRHGPWVQLDRTGRELGRMNLSNGSGIWRIWHSSGGLAINGSLTEGRREGTWRFFFRAGMPALIGMYARDQKQGVWQWFYNDGNPLRTVSFRGGQRHGLYTDWWTSGNKRKEGAYQRGLRDGEWLRWSRDGRLLGVHQLREGTGEWAEWYTSGNLREAGPVRDDKRNGRWRVWHESGALKQEGRYQNHVRRADTWRYFDVLGQPTKRRVTVRGRGIVSGRGTSKVARLTRLGMRGLIGPSVAVRGGVVTMGRGGLGTRGRAARGRGLARLSTRGTGRTPRSHLAVKAGRVKNVTIAWVSKTKGVRLAKRQPQMLRVLIRACSQRFSIKHASAGVRPRGGGKAMVSSVLRWTVHVRGNGTVQRANRSQTPRTLTDRGGLRCADYVISRAQFVPRANQSNYTVTLSATLIH